MGIFFLICSEALVKARFFNRSTHKYLMSLIHSTDLCCYFGCFETESPVVYASLARLYFVGIWTERKKILAILKLIVLLLSSECQNYRHISPGTADSANQRSYFGLPTCATIMTN